MANDELVGNLATENLLLYLEQHKVQTNIDLGKFAQAWGFKPAKTESATKYALFPIPKQQLDANSKLTQNPGY